MQVNEFIDDPVATVIDQFNGDTLTANAYDSISRQGWVIAFHTRLGGENSVLWADPTEARAFAAKLTEIADAAERLNAGDLPAWVE